MRDVRLPACLPACLPVRGALARTPPAPSIPHSHLYDPQLPARPCAMLPPERSRALVDKMDALYRELHESVADARDEDGTLGSFGVARGYDLLLVFASPLCTRQPTPRDNASRPKRPILRLRFRWRDKPVLAFIGIALSVLVGVGRKGKRNSSR